MAALEVGIENLEPMIIVMAHAVSESPERDAWNWKTADSKQGSEPVVLASD